jgi:hypothetical protein
MTAAATRKLALLWRGDREARCNATPHSNRFKRVFEELATIGISAEPAVYADEMASEVQEQLLNVDGVLVWVDPISKEQGDRSTLDAMLRNVASRGIWVSADPDVILKMERSPSSHKASGLGQRHPSLLHSCRIPRSLSGATSVRWSARSQAKSWQRRARRMEGRTHPPIIRPTPSKCSRSARTSGQRVGRYAARRLHETLRGLFRR